MKPFYTFLIVILVAGFSESLVAQEFNPDRLKRLAERAEGVAERQKEAAIEYARENDIPVRRVLEDGTVIEIQKLDENGHPQYYTTHNEDAAASVKADKLYSGGGLGLSVTGAGYSDVGEWDGGKVLNTHQEFGNRITLGDGASSVSDHATHVAGTIIAAGIDNSAQGMAPDAELTTHDWGNDDSEMASAASNGLEISNHSYGYLRGWSYDGDAGEWKWYGDESISSEEDYKFGFYSNGSQSWDQIAYNAPNYLIVKSAGNDRGDGPGSDPSTAEQDGGDNGYDCIGTRGVAKNLLTVAAVKDVTNYTGPESVEMSSFSSWGPADDGRIKPDIAANGVSLYSTTSGSNSSYGTKSGTSMSSPNTTGVATLLQKHYRNTHGGSSMTAASLKGLITTTASEAGEHTGPDYKFGWGLLNAEKAAQVITRDNAGESVIQEKTLNGGDTFTRDITLGDQSAKITIAWTDPAGNPVSAQLDPRDPMLVNDLDLKVKGPNDQVFYPWSLDPDNPDAAATNNGENDVDNVEQVFIENPTPGQYTLIIDHEGSLTNGAQDYSIIIDNIGDQKKVHFSGYEVDDDNLTSSGDDDGKVEPGETIELPVKLANNTINDLNGVSATLSTNDPSITNISDDYENYGDIDAGGSAFCQFDYDFTVDSTAPYKEVEFYLNITDGNQTWVDTFTVPIHGPVVHSDHEIDDDNNTSSGNDDGKIDPGETIELPVELTNNTSNNLSNVNATISANDPHVTNISDDYENYGDINSGESAWATFDYDFTIDPDCPEKDIQFVLDINADNGSWTDTITLHVEGQATYADHEIDDDNSTSSGNDDGIVDAGEKIELPVQIANLTDDTLSSPSATLSTDDPYITDISDSYENYDDIPSGDSAWCGFDYDFTVHEDAPSKNVTFKLEINANGETWTDSFDIAVNGSNNIAYTDHEIDDDEFVSDGDDDSKVEPGETIELPLRLGNFSTTEMTNVSADLSTNDPVITNISDSQENFGTIAAGDSAWTEFDYDFTVAHDAPEKEVEFVLNITADAGSWTDTFTIDVHGEVDYLSHEIDDDQFTSDGNDNSKVEPGEKIELPLQLVNNNSSRFTNVSAELSTDDTLITNISDANENYGDIASGDSSWCEFDYDFTVDSAAPQTRITFTLNITSDNHSWTDTFSVKVHGPVGYAAHEVDDDQSTSDGDDDSKVEPGEKIELPVQLVNKSITDLSGVSADLSTNDPNITNISDDYETFGNISGNDSAWTQFDYDFTVDSSCPEKDIEFYLDITSDAGQTWKDTFTVHVYDPNSSQPNPESKEQTTSKADEPESSNVDVAVYPNPTAGKVSLSIENSEDAELDMCILSTNGQRVLCDQLEPGTGGGDYERQFDLSGEAKGVYFLKITGNNTQSIKRIVVQ